MFDSIEGSEEQDTGRKLKVMAVLVRFQIEIRTQLGF